MHAIHPLPLVISAGAGQDRMRFFSAITESQCIGDGSDSTPDIWAAWAAVVAEANDDDGEGSGLKAIIANVQGPDSDAQLSTAWRRSGYAAPEPKHL